jgi:hypothetical protein
LIVQEEENEDKDEGGWMRDGGETVCATVKTLPAYIMEGARITVFPILHLQTSVETPS